MLAATCPAAAPEPASYAAADATFAETRAFASSREAWQMSESDLERELDRRGRELIRSCKDSTNAVGRSSRSGGGGRRRALRAADARTAHRDDVGTVRVARAGYARAGVDSLHPLDAALNLPAERSRWTLRRSCVAFVRRSALGVVPQYRRAGAQASGGAVVARAAVDFDAFYEARRRPKAGCGRLDRRADLRQQVSCCTARTCARRRARRPRSAGGNASACRRSSA